MHTELGNPGRADDLSWAHKEIRRPKYTVNILHVNADSMKTVRKHYGRELFRHRYNIGVWHWELPVFPDEFVRSFQYVDEVWAPTRFILDSLAPKSPVPLVRIPHGIEVRVPTGMSRSAFGLPEDRFLFLSMYDTLSFQERKNPLAAIEAFQRAFGREDARVGLVVKVSNSRVNPEEIVKLQEKIDGHPGIYLLDAIFDRPAANALMNAADCFVSLHRSEGFGLGLAEAMYLGKPALGTGWSGNADFMNADNSCPVGYRLIRVGRDLGPYRADQLWADPDIEHAVWYMRKLVNDESWRSGIALRGQRTIREEYSPAVVGRMIKKRLKRLKLL
jgi:glycosyltransferase involved in cell wall biosynthesis